MKTRTARIIRSRRHRRQQQRGSAARLLRGILVSLVVVLVFIMLLLTTGSGIALAVYRHYADQLPAPSELETAQADVFETTILYDRTGQHVLYEIIPPDKGDRQRASVYDVPQYFLDATVAIEDARFYENPGFDIKGIARAFWVNLTGGQVQGGSTITQQLVRNVLLTEEERQERTFDRKMKEVILASEIARIYSKEQILEWYINTNFYGNLAYGVEAAARLYFDKPARDLTLAEATLLAAIPQFPLQNPIDNPEAARLRQEIVLHRMVLQGYITQEEADAARAEVIVIKPVNQRFEITAPHFSLYARSEAEALLNQKGLDGTYLMARGGLRIYTTLDLDLQYQLECVARTHVTRLDGAKVDYVHSTATGEPCYAADYLPGIASNLIGVDRTVTNAAGVVIKANTGEIVAMIGSVDFWNEGIDGNFNVALAERQPASTFKPIVYITAFLIPLDRSTIVTPATMTSDVPLEFTTGSPEPYIPHNIDFTYHGPVSVRDALANSFNIPAVQVLNWIGLSSVINTAHRLGINSLNDSLSEYGLSLALGAGEVKLIDLTYAYNVFNAGGYSAGTPVYASEARPGYRQLNPVSILRIEDSDGHILWEYSEESGTFDRRLVIPSGMAYIMTDILADREARLQAFEPGNPLELSNARPAAAKTGTTDDNRDSWTIGYTPQYTTGIWVGNNDNTPMADVTGMVGAAPIWHAIMEYLHQRDNIPVTDWERPVTVREQTVCLWSGLLPTENCPQVPGELFFVDTASNIDYRPQKRDDLWYRRAIDTCNNALANETTPPQCIDEPIFFDFPPEMQEWAETNHPELLPPKKEGVVAIDSPFSRVAIVSPRFPDQVSGLVDVYGNTSVDDLSYYQLNFGRGNEPESFSLIGENGTTIDANHLLGVWDTSSLPDGVYTLRLQVVKRDNTVETASTRVTVDNTVPELRLIEPRDGTTYYADTDIFITLQAEVYDAGDIAKVEFYINETTSEQIPVEQPEDEEGIFIGESSAFPYSIVWPIEESGLKTFWAIAYDRAGNRAQSAKVIINLEDHAPNRPDLY